MRLRSQLLLASILVLLLPFASWQYLNEMGRELRFGGQNALQLRTAAIETLMSQSPDRAALDVAVQESRDLFAETTDHTILLDGYTDDWSVLLQPPFSFSYADNKTTPVIGSGVALAEVDLRLAVDTSYLYLHFRVRDNRVVYHRPDGQGTTSGDRIYLFLPGENGENERFTLRAIAPGTLSALQMLHYSDEVSGEIRVPDITGYWEAQIDGYTVELRMPRPENGGGFGFAVVDVDDPTQQQQVAWVGTVDPENSELTGHLHYSLTGMEDYLMPLVPAASRLRVFNREGWLVADINRLVEHNDIANVIDPETAGLIPALLYRLLHATAPESVIPREHVYRMAGSTRLSATGSVGDVSQSGRYRYSGMIVNGLLKPLEGGDGYVLLETLDESVGAVINSTLTRLFLMFLVLSTVLALGLLMYAGWLSRRVRRISLAAAGALHGDGSIGTDIPGSDARDEIGDLSRSIEQMLARLSSYTDYLQNLASRLTHELRTPLAVMSTSLEHLNDGELGPQQREYLQRATDAGQRLHGLIRSMSEATRLEQAVQSAEFAVVDLADWLQAVSPIYQDLYPDRTIRVAAPSEMPVLVMSSPELLQQMLDKLMANARDFSDDGDSIELSLRPVGGRALLSVSNQGSLLADDLAAHVFDPMVSRRDSEDGVHLGLGLYIVRLVAEAHNGKTEARNRADGQGVTIEVDLPIYQGKE